MLTATTHALGSTQHSAQHAESGVVCPDAYTWFVLLSALDVMVTHAILFHFDVMGGYEANPLAAWIIKQFDFTGAIVLKFAVVMFVIVLAEVVGRTHRRTAERMMRLVLLIATFPVAVGLMHIARIAMGA